MKLGPRLAGVARWVTGPRHCDVGSDHGYLPRFLLETGQVQGCLVIEKRSRPLALAARNLAGLGAELRLADGLEALEAGEVDSLSLSGLGGLTITRILKAHPERVPDRLVVQCNDYAGPEIVRRWACSAGFHLLGEEWVQEGRLWIVQVFERRAGADPVYGPQSELEKTFGPHLLRTGGVLLEEWLTNLERSLLRADQVAQVRDKLQQVDRARAYAQEAS